MDDLVKRLRYQHENGLFASVRAGKDVNLAEAADCIEALQEKVKLAEVALDHLALGKHLFGHPANHDTIRHYAGLAVAQIRSPDHG